MPLAVVQATAYIKHPASRCSVSQYLELFRTSDPQRVKLLGYEAGHASRYGDAKNSVLAPWQISFDHLRTIKPAATEILSLMSLFDRHGIPLELLQETMIENARESSAAP
jgi:hypothetical protein